jgi:hypothetical protein
LHHHENENTCSMQVFGCFLEFGSALVAHAAACMSVSLCVRFWLGCTLFRHFNKIGCVHRLHTNSKQLAAFGGLVPPWFHVVPHAAACMRVYSVYVWFRVRERLSSDASERCCLFIDGYAGIMTSSKQVSLMTNSQHGSSLTTLQKHNRIETFQQTFIRRDF